MNTFSILNPLNEEQEVPSPGYLLVTVSCSQQIGYQNLLNHSNTGGFISSRIPKRVVLKSEKRDHSRSIMGFYIINMYTQTGSDIHV